MNKNIGNEYEDKLIKLLFKHGWWCHLFAYKPEGQPCDVIALKDNKYLLLDVKHCSGKRFPFSDIRPNQKTCFALARKQGNTNNGFAIYFEQVKEWRWLDFDDLCKMEKDGWKSVCPLDCTFMFGEKDELDNQE
jgi:Holliday junction resolvase